MHVVVYNFSYYVSSILTQMQFIVASHHSGAVIYVLQRPLSGTATPGVVIEIVLTYQRLKAVIAQLQVITK